jgi:ABC-type bacteriocin/lantibiotic exporter with double-glycine peptidase domain
MEAIQYAAEALGLSCQAINLSEFEVMPSPLIVHRTDGHFLVLCKSKGEEWLVLDPVGYVETRRLVDLRQYLSVLAIRFGAPQTQSP